jgi:hypothetical protein
MFTNKFSTDKINEKIARHNNSTEIKDIRTLPDFHKILSENPNRNNVNGFYAEIPLSDYQTFVPNGRNFPDRYDKHYEEGQFDAPLFTLKEWRDNWGKGHPASSKKPDLLINANWFNVWQSGVVNFGEKINPRTQSRTYLAGLSVSRGKLVSSHKVLDQNKIGLDTILFDTKHKIAALISHENIDAELEKDPDLYKNKNAVSGFIILSNNATQKTPDLNNNHSNRLPRTGVGYKNNGKILIVMTIHNQDRNCGVTAEEFADLFTALQCTDAINLDNSGSTELYYNGLGELGRKHVTIKTKTCDAGAPTERPKPNCLGFSKVSKPTFFAKDDTDISNRRITGLPVRKKISKSDDNINYSYYIKR